MFDAFGPMPRHNSEVNGHWMCDEGRYAYRAIDASNRLKHPTVRNSDSGQKMSWEDAVRRAATELRGALEKHGPGGVAVLASPQMTNEDLFFLRRLFRDCLNVGSVECRVPPREAVYSDSFLITADKNPNSRGAELLGLAGEGTDALLAACAEGRIHYLYICHQDLTRGFGLEHVEAALGKVEFIVFQGSWEDPVSRLADVQLPAAVYAEKEGTFTNLQGRVQRIHAAVPPLGDALPDLDILALLAGEIGAPISASTPAEVFRQLAECVEPFAGMSYETIADCGMRIAD